MTDIQLARLELHYESDKKVTIPGPKSEALAKALYDWGLSTSPQEVGWVVTMNATKRLHTIVEVARGSNMRLPIHSPTLLSAVLTSGADRFIFVHNHPGGSIEPSTTDITLTQQISDAAAVCGLYFEDHIIVTGHPTRLTSMRLRGLYIPPEEDTRTGLMRAAGYE